MASDSALSRGLSAFVTALAICGSPVEADVELTDIIHNVESNELLYSNIELIFYQTYEDFTPASPTPSSDPAVVNDPFVRYVNSSQKILYVSQRDMFRFDRKGQAALDSGTSATLDRNRGFDGKTTRLYDQNAIGNIVTGRAEDEFIRPHMLLLRRPHWLAMVPLSSYLKGHDAMAAHPNVKWPKHRVLDNAYRGEEEYRGLRCQKVSITTISAGQPVGRWELWLAEERNYIPVRMLAFTFRISKEIPVGEARVNQWQEIEAGIWFPTAAKAESYDNDLIEREGKQRLAWREQYTIEEVSFNPNHDVAFFREVAFPDGTSVYEIENGKIVRSYRQGAPDSPEGPSANSAFVRWWLLWANLGLVLIVAGILVSRRLIAMARSS